MSIIKALIGGTFGVIKSLIKYSFYTTLIVTGGAITVARITKPKEGAFQKYLTETAKNNITSEHIPIVSNLIDLTMNTAVGTVCKVEEHDYIIAQVGTLKCGKSIKRYIGVFNNWFEL